MEKFKKSLTQRISAMVGLIASSNAMMALSNSGLVEKHRPEGNFGDFLQGFQLGLFIILMLFSVGYIAYLGATLKNEERLKACYIKETDERNVRISELAGRKLYLSLVLPILAAAVISGYFSPVVFFTLLSVAAFISLVVALRILYFSKTL